jgi:predicted amidohydrolase
VTRIACAQLAPELGAFAENCARSEAAVADAVADGARLVVLPELVTSGYVFESVAEAASLAITPEHPVFQRWHAALGGTDGVVVGGFCEHGADGRLYNSAALVDAAGLRAVYRKTHLWDREKLFFTPGDALPPVLDTSVGAVGVLICYDQEFPELTRSIVLAGADLLAIPTNWPLTDYPADEHPPEVLIAMVTARTNRVAVAVCDRSGTERGVRWAEGTSVIDQNGVRVATARGVATALAEVDLTLSRDKRITEHNDVLADRRPELYAAVSDERAGPARAARPRPS